MTNSSNSPRTLPKIIIIHGLNNDPQSFTPLAEVIKKWGYTSTIMTLPGHGENREEIKDKYKSEFIFATELKRHTQDPHIIVAFSLGALYLQNWLRNNKTENCLGQILLAPAIFIRKWNLIRFVIPKIPSWISFRSLSPKSIRRFDQLYFWEYQNLVHTKEQFNQSINAPTIPTTIIVDPKDELINTQELEAYATNHQLRFIPFIKKDYPKIRGVRHIIFHPKFFSEKSWIKFTVLLETEIKSLLR